VASSLRPIRLRWAGPIRYVNIDVVVLHAHSSGLAIRRADSKVRVGVTNATSQCGRLVRLTGTRYCGVCRVSVSDAIYHLYSCGGCGIIESVGLAVALDFSD